MVGNFVGGNVTFSWLKDALEPTTTATLAVSLAIQFCWFVIMLGNPGYDAGLFFFIFCFPLFILHALYSFIVGILRRNKFLIVLSVLAAGLVPALVGLRFAMDLMAYRNLIPVQP